MELQTLVEEDEAIDQMPLEQETRFSASLDHSMQWGDHMTMDTPTQFDDQMFSDNQALLSHTDEEALNRNNLRDSFMSDGTGSNRVSTFNVSSCILIH